MKLMYLIKRNTKLYFKDMGMFLTSLITPVILLVLYSTFLSGVFEDVFRSAFAEAGFTPSDKLIAGCAGGQLVSSLLAVSCVTVAFCSNFLMVQDKVTGARNDFRMAPVGRGTLALGYYLSNLLSTLIVCVVAAGLCFAYLGATGWFLSVSDILYTLLDVVLLVLFGCALSSIVNFFLSTQGQISAVGTVVSAGYGFICGAYMPISNFSEGLQTVLSFLPGTYGTSLLRNHMLNGVFNEMSSIGVPDVAINAMRDSVDCNVHFFGTQVGEGTMYIILAAAAAVLIGLYVVINLAFTQKRK